MISAGSNRALTVCFVLLIVLLGGCALCAKYLSSVFYRPAYVAVLPFENQTNDMIGPELMRKLFARDLARKGYRIQPQEETDVKLRDAGITDGGQLPTITSRELAQKLGVDAAFYGTLHRFNFVTLGFYSDRSVHASFRLISLNDNNVLWEDERKVSNKDFAFSEEEIKENLKEQLAVKMVEKIFKSPLLRESEEVIRRTLRTLP